MIVKLNVQLTELHLDEVNKLIIKYKTHTSIKTIKDRMVELNYPIFSFGLICREEIVREIDKLCNKKASQNTEALVTIIKENEDLISYFLHHSFNKLLSCSTFSTAIKFANVKPIHKKENKTDKEIIR